MPRRRHETALLGDRDEDFQGVQPIPDYCLK
jgi:hypothetical protein